MQRARPVRLAPDRSRLAESLHPTLIDVLRVPETQLDRAPRQLATLRAALAVTRVHASAASEDRAAARGHRLTCRRAPSSAPLEPAPHPFDTRVTVVPRTTEHRNVAWETSAKPGESPSPETIAYGTVRMEDHPNFGTLINEASSKGVVIIYGDYGDRARIEIVHVVDDAGNLLEIRVELQLVPGMRYLDLEHEMGHLRQLERFGAVPPPTKKVVRRGGIEETARGSLASGKLTDRMGSIAEYHNRLEEYIRLAGRKVPPSLLEERAEGLDHWRTKAEEYGLGRAGSLNEWAQRYFSDIPTLEARCHELGLVLVPNKSRWRR
jgi:hypothetical protein